MQKKAPDPTLKDLIAELALIQSMQRRLHARTALYGKQYEGEFVPAPVTAKDPQEREKLETIQRELKALGERQGTISRLLLAIAAHPQQPG